MSTTTTQTTAPRTARSAALRRYPALAWLVGAGLLALLLPSGLTLPQSGPPTLAEYAPVPGAGEGRSDLGDLASGQSVGLGGGTPNRASVGGEQVTPESPADPRQVVRKAGTKRCVGDPPRQTEDRLSPPCIAFFDGDNGGATSKGVTRDVVTVAIEMADVDVGDPRERQAIACDDPPDLEDDTIADLACKAYMRYFNDRYQTYGRTVRLLSSHSVSLDDLDDRHKLFAHLHVRTPNGSGGNRGVMAFGYRGMRRASYANLAPYAVTFSPDNEAQAMLSASYLCLKLQGGTARYAGDPTLRDDERVFGFWYQEAGYKRQRDELHAAIRASCGLDVRIQATAHDNPTSATHLRSSGVTTVIAIGNQNHLPFMTKLATDQGWFPEWFVPGSGQATGFDSNSAARLAVAAQWQNAFGVMFDVRRDAITDQPWFVAYREGCPSCPEPRVGMVGVNDIAAAYDTISMLFYGIQAAGPRLTPDNVDRGLHSIPSDRSVNPYKPAAYFAPGDWSFVKDATAIWWDPTGRAPSATGAGCYRLVDGGARFRAGEWPAGDADVRGTGPCQADKIAGA